MATARISASSIVLLLCFGLMAYSSFVFYPRWKQKGTESAIAHDVCGYYWYLPSVFIYKDLKKQGFKDSLLKQYEPSGAGNLEQGYWDSSSGNYVLKYSSGMAVLYLPAFISGHLAASWFGYPQDGLSLPYQFCLQLWGLLFSFLGLFYLRRLLLFYFQDTIVAIVLFLLVFGSNYLNYAAIDSGMSHTWLFTLYVLLLLYIRRYYQTLKSRYLIQSALLVGLMTLIRPTEIISSLLVIFWGLDTWSSLKGRFRYLSQHKILLVSALLSAFAVVSIQLMYWHYITGNWIVYSYQEQGFNFIKPHAFIYSWSYKAGWLTYSPMLILSFWGLLLYPKYGKSKLAVIIFFMLNYYIVTAWNIWDYGGFSGRAMIQSYPVILFPMATLVEFSLQRNWLKYILMPLALLFLYANIWWTYQAHKGGLVDAFHTTKAYFWKMAGRWSVEERYIKLKDTDELPEAEPEELKLLYRDNSDVSYCVDETVQEMIIQTIPYHITDKYKWIRASAVFYFDQKEWDIWRLTQFKVVFLSRGTIVKTRMLSIQRFMDQAQEKRLYLDVKVPDENFDQIRISFWNKEGRKRNCLKGLEVMGF